MNSVFQLKVKKVPGGEARLDFIIRVMEAEGWVAHRHLNKAYVLLATKRLQHMFKSEIDVKKYLRTMMETKDLWRFSVITVC